VVSVTTGVIKETEGGSAQVFADGVFVHQGHVYVSAPLPGALGITSFSVEAVQVIGARHGLAVMTADGKLKVRLVGDSLPADVTVRVATQRGRPHHRPYPVKVDVVRIRLVGAQEAGGQSQTPENRQARREFFEAQATAWSRETWDPLHHFASARARYLAGSPAGRGQRGGRAGARPQSDLGEIMSLYTGLSSIEEALQTDRGLNTEPSEEDTQTLPLAEVQGVPLPVHPWPAMQARLFKDAADRTGGGPRMEPLAGRVPGDMLYAHFHDLRTAVKLAADVEEWWTPFARLAEWRSGTSHVMERLEEQLMLERTGLAERLGHLAVTGVAIAVGDPFVREGTDVTVLFGVRNETLLLGVLGRHESVVRSRVANVQEESYTVEVPQAPCALPPCSAASTVTVRHVFTPDRRVNQYRALVDGVLFVSNSRRALKRFLVADGPRLSESGDFRYFRSLYPFDTAQEDAYLFLSDAFVAKAVSPRTRILESRRMHAGADLRAVNYAALMHGWLEGQGVPQKEALLAGGVLLPADLKHADGSEITFHPTSGAWSERWGRLTALTPLIELDIERVSAREKAAYEAFARSYQTYWRDFIDPVAVRLKRSADGQHIQVDARMLPLIEGTDYRELFEIVGDATVTPPRAGNGLQWTLAIGEEASLRRELGRLAGHLGGRQLQFDWLGDWISLGLRDGVALWEMAILTNSLAEIPGEVRRSTELEYEIANRFPGFIAIQVRNNLGAVAFLTAFRAFVEGAAPSLVTWGQAGTHREVPIVSVAIRPDNTNAASATVTLHYALANNVLAVSMNRTTLTAVIDQALDGSGPGGPGEDKRQAMLSVEPGPWLAQTMAALLDRDAIRQYRAADRDLRALVRGLGRLPNGVERRRLALAYLGFEPAAVQGGEFSEFKPDLLEHSMYGTWLRPNIPVTPIAGAPVTRLLSHLKSLKMALSVEGQGSEKGLHVQLEWQRRSEPQF
jgi:hypothetical protein